MNLGFTKINLFIFCTVLGITPLESATISVTSTSDANTPGTLRNALSIAQPGDTIVFNTTGTIVVGNITNTALPLINDNLTITGNGNTISGQNGYPIFFALNGNVNISNLNLDNGKGLGGNGGDGNGGGGGALGAGAALFINTGSNVTLTNISFSGNTVNGGNGGNNVSAAHGGGGGGGGYSLLSSPSDGGSTSPLNPPNDFAGGGGGGIFGSSGGEAVYGGAGGGGLFNSDGGTTTSEGGGGGGGGSFFSNGGSAALGGGGGGGVVFAGASANLGDTGGGGGGGWDNPSPTSPTGVVNGGNGGGQSLSGTGGTGVNGSPSNAADGQNAGTTSGGGGGGGGGAQNLNISGNSGTGGNGGHGNAKMNTPGTGGGGGGGGSSLATQNASAGGNGGLSDTIGGGGGGGGSLGFAISGPGGDGGSSVLGGGGGGGLGNPGGKGGNCNLMGGGGGGGGGEPLGVTSGGAGGDGGIYGGGGAGGFGATGGSSSFGGGGGGSNNATVADGGFGGGNGGTTGLGGNGGSALGGAIFVRNGGILTINDGAFSGNVAGSIGTGGTPSGILGMVSDGNDLYLMNASALNFNVSSSHTVNLSLAGHDNQVIFGTGLGGSLTKTGGGTLAIASRNGNSYNGNIFVDAGFLQLNNSNFGSNVTVNPGGTLNGNGTVNSILNSGTVAPSNVINTGTYIQQSNGTYDVVISSNGTNTLLNASGQASLAGTLGVTANPGSYLAGTTWDILNGNPVTGTFSTTRFPSGFNFQVNYFPTFVQLLLLNNVIGATIGPVCENGQRVRDYLSNLKITPGSDLSLIFQNLNTLTTANDLCKALLQLQSSPLATLNWSNAWNMARINEEIVSRTEELFFCPCCCDPCCGSEGSGWIETYGEVTRQNHLGHLPGFRTHTGGIIGGWDRRLCDDYLVGIGGGWSYTNLKWKEFGGDSRFNSFYLAPYAAWTNGAVLLNASVMGTYNRFNTNRHIHFVAINRHAKSHYSGYGILAHLGGKVSMPLDCVEFNPFMSADYIYLQPDRIHEHGADSVNLRVHKRHIHAFWGELGAEIANDISFCQGILRPSVALSWIYFQLFSGDRLPTAFVGQPPGFTTLTTHRSLNLIAPTVELEYVLCDFTLKATYEGAFGPHTIDNAGSIRFSWDF